MRRILQILALALFLGGAGLWVAKGAHRGWTKTSVPVRELDEVTGLEGISYRRAFVPGLDFLGGVALGSGILAGVARVFRNKPRH